MHRFFVEPRQMAGDRFPLPEAIVHQVTRVLRLRDRAQILRSESVALAAAAAILSRTGDFA
jgi:16S rRNA U1498 N3-methylase RsmE